MYFNIINFLKSQNGSNFRIQQLDTHIFKYNNLTTDNLLQYSKPLREELKKYNLEALEIVKETTDEYTEKILFKTLDGQYIETVLMKHYNRNTVCVSSQIFCSLGCKFCATGSVPFKRNLTAWEIVLQVLLIKIHKRIRVDNIVYMGMGEPFLNFDNIKKSLDIFNNKIKIGARHISVSTCGIIPGILDFIKLEKQYRLAISLHAPNDTIRNSIMPINQKYPLDELMKTLDIYVKETKRRVTYEYVLIDGVNDSIECAEELVELLKDKNAFVNLIIYNEHKFAKFKKPSIETVTKFKNHLTNNHINAVIRKSLGDDISGACGQLSAEKE